MNVVDSSGWIEFFKAGPNGPVFKPAIEDRHHLLVPTIALFEVHKVLSRSLSDGLVTKCLDVMRLGRVLDLTDARAIAASKTSRQHKLALADAAMYSAKEGGRGTFRFYNPGLTEAIHQRLELDTRMRRGLDRREFVLHYQAKVDCDGCITGVEALVRWQPPNAPLMPPDQFTVAVAVFTVQDDFAAGGAEVTRHRWDGGVFALVDVGHIAGVVDQFSRSTAWAFHGHSSLNETIKTSSMTVNLRYTSSPLLVLAWYTSCQIR